MVRIAVVEDDQTSAETFTEYIRRYEAENDFKAEVTCFTDGADLVRGYRPVYDIIFLDIQMPLLDGMSAAERIRRMDTDVILIFITNMAQYAIRGYAVDAMDFLLKPVPYFAFSQQLRRSAERLARRRASYLLLPCEGGVVRMDTARILYIESLRHRITVYTQDGEYSLTATMKEFEEKPALSGFFRCNSGCLVNLAHVSGVQDGCAMVEGRALPVSRARKKAFLDALTDYVGGSGQ